MLSHLSLASLLAVALIFFLLSLALYYLWALLPRSGTAEWIHLRERQPFRFVGGRYPLGKLDVLILALIVVLWGALTLFNLGDRVAPQTFHGFEEDEYVFIDLGEPTDVSRVRFFSGLNEGEYFLYFSPDGATWQRQGAMTQGFAEQFKWLEAEVLDGTGIKYLRISATEVRGRPLYLGELVIYDSGGRRLTPTALWWSDPARTTDTLFDEAHLVPDRQTVMNSMYFDEIYHAQAAYQYIQGVWPYAELSHPPLGKIFIALGILLFDMTPFGWRFMGAAIGTLILALFYCMVKGMFEKRLVAICATLIFGASFMHFTQTRISTIDTYTVLFVLLQFWFIYRYISQDYETPFAKTLPSLFFAGVFFGLGAASKWSSLYLAPALAGLWLYYQILRGKHYKQTEQKGFDNYLFKTVVTSCVFFILVPGIIYYLTYIPLGRVHGYGVFSADFFHMVIANQRHMWWFHNAVTAEHAFASPWYLWVFNIRPILYYLNRDLEGYRSLIMAFGNPVLHWGGLLAMIFMPVAAYRKGDGRAFAIFVAYIVLLLPWIFIPRPAFSYHYFPNLIFLTLALACVFDHLIRRERGYYKTTILALTGVAVGLFALFYPVLSGHPMTDWYGLNVLRWFESWPIY